MNWEAVGAFVEIVGAIAVVITLIYLARQMRQNSSALRSTTAQSANEMAFSVYNPIVANEYGLADILLRGLRDPELLSGLEMARFTARWQAHSLLGRTSFINIKMGILTTGFSWDSLAFLQRNSETFWKSKC